MNINNGNILFKMDKKEVKIRKLIINVLNNNTKNIEVINLSKYSKGINTIGIA